MTDEIKKRIVPTERGLGYDLSVSYVGRPVPPNTNFSYTGADWFGPLPPLKPIAPPEVAGRAWDFLPGYNLTTQPRVCEPISFPTLRMLADSYDPVRLVIERRKDQLCRLPWTIRLKHEGATKRPSKAALSAQLRGKIRNITEFFQAPDYEVTFRSWLRSLLEDVFVIDAPSIFCERTRGGELIALPIIDGSTIKVVIDDWGRRPRPFPWTGESFIWNGETVTSENFAERGFKHVRGLVYPPAFQQVLKGLPAVDYSTLDLLYRPMNLRPGRVYGSSPVEQIAMTVNIAMRRSISQFEYFEHGNTPEALYSLPESWTPDQVQKFQDYWDNLLAGNLGRRRQMRFMAGGAGSYVALKEPPLKAEIDEFLIRIVCFAFSYPPSAFVRLSNRSVAEQHERTAEEEGLQPIKQWVGDLINEVISRDFDADELEFAWIEEDEIDQEKQASILSRYVETGILSVNQARERLGEEPDPNPAANTLMTKTPTGYVPIGGTNQEGECFQ